MIVPPHLMEEVSAERKEKISAKIKVLNNEKSDLETKLKKERDFNRAAWNEYSSELCASEMGNNELAIENEIIAVNKKIELLYFCLYTGINAVLLEEDLNREISTVSNRIAFLKKHKKALQKNLDDVVLMKKLLKESGAYYVPRR